ncbi:MAG: S9 family peptidase [Phycisphaerales bacterium]|nr:MAG: S9 family peptidase [Phycisphaerales bacterium]
MQSIQSIESIPSIKSIESIQSIKSIVPSPCVRFLVFALLLAPLHVRAQDSVFTPAHVARLRSVTSVAIAPDGRFIAYTLSVPRQPFVDDNGPAWTELHVVDQAGRSRPFVAGAVNVENVEWTPDGRGISFTCKRGDDEHAALYVIPIDGGEAVKVLEHDAGVGDYAWSPDGAEVAFLSTDEKPESVKDDEKKGFNADVYEEQLRFSRVYVARPRMTPAERDEDDWPESRKLALDGHATHPTWSPDGKHLAVALAPTPLIDDHYMKRRIHVVDAAAGTSVARVETAGKIGDFRWSPDGQHLAIIAGADQHDPSAGRLMVASVEGGSPRDIMPGYPGEVAAVGWQNDATIMYLGDEGVTTRFAKLNIDGSGGKTLIDIGKHVLAGLSLSRDGMAAAFISDSPRHPGEVFAMSHGQPEPRRLTDSNPWLDGLRFAKQEPVGYKARDGLDIQGVLIHPLNEEPGRRYPLILSVHGGPESHERHGWKTSYSRPGQVAAARGMAVFYPNYRGSTGRGVAFSKLDQADYAGAEFDDLVDAITYLSDIGLVDKSKVGVTGGSYGGFASAWCATALSEHFAAAVMFVGISDQVSMFGTTEIPNEWYQVHARKYPWDDWSFFDERSPVRHAENARTPILILHGKDDPRVHPSQSMTLYRYLKTLGNVPVRLVQYPGEGHGNRSAASRLDYNLRMIRWLEHYLLGPGGDPPSYELDYSAYRPKEKDEDEVEGRDAGADSPAITNPPA